MCLLTGVVHVLNWLGVRMKETKEKIIASHRWLATRLRLLTLYLSFWVVDKHIQCSLSSAGASVSELLVSILNFNGVGHRLGLHQDGL